MATHNQGVGHIASIPTSAPKILLVLFGAILLVEVITFFALAQWAPVIRFFLLAALMVFTLHGSKVARGILVFLLLAGAALLTAQAFVSAAPPLFLLTFHFLPAAVLMATAGFLLSKRGKALGGTAPDTAADTRLKY